jgi:hypothetical protein
MKCKKTISTIALTILILSIITSCTAKAPNDSKRNENPGTKTEVTVGSYLPLRIGNIWEYAGTGNEYASYTQKVTYQKDNKYQVMVNNGGTITANRYEITGSSIVITYREGEVYDNRNILDKPANTETIILKQPIKAGTTWKSEKSMYKITKTDSTVKVPAGTFDKCVEVEITGKGSNSRTYNYYKEGIGLVKSEFVVESGDKITSDLKKYTLVNGKVK